MDQGLSIQVLSVRTNEWMRSSGCFHVGRIYGLPSAAPTKGENPRPTINTAESFSSTIQESISWHDSFMSENELLRVYAGADVLVLFHGPGQDNYQSGLVSDALASGLPDLGATPTRYERTDTSKVWLSAGWF